MLEAKFNDSVISNLYFAVLLLTIPLRTLSFNEVEAASNKEFC